MICEEYDQKNGYAFTWSINNFSCCWQEAGEAIVSPTFFICKPEKTKWKLLLFPRGIQNRNFIALFLYRDKDCEGAEEIEVKYGLQYLQFNHHDSMYHEFNHIICKNSQGKYICCLHRGNRGTLNIPEYLPRDILTVRCTIVMLNNECLERQEVKARSIINVEKKSFRWMVQNFSDLKPDQKLPFTIKSVSEEVLIKIYMFITSTTSEEKINFSIRCFDRSMKFFSVIPCVLSTGIGTSEVCEYVCRHKKWSTFCLTLTRTKIMKNKNIYLPNDTLTLFFKLGMSTGFGFQGIEDVDFGTISNANTNVVREMWQKYDAGDTITASALSTDLMFLLKDQSLSDMKLKTKTNLFPVHTAILGARSPVFKTMFSSDTKEKDGCVQVYDLNDKTVAQLLLYLYTDKLEGVEWDDAKHLYKAADKYAIIPLKYLCSAFLKNNLDVHNACEVLILSHLHSDEELKILAQDILLNENEIFITPEWKRLVDAYPKLAYETIRRHRMQD